MKKLILLLVILLVLGGGAAAVWWFFLKPKDETAQAEEPPPPPPVLTQIDLPLTSVSIINGNKSTQRIDFLITVVFDDPEKQKKVEDRPAFKRMLTVARPDGRVAPPPSLKLP